MEFLSATKLQEHNIDISIRNNSTISWKGKLYERKKVFSKSYRNKAFSIYKENLKSNLSTLLVEYKNYLAVWVEKQLKTNPGKEKSLTILSPKSTPKKKIIKKYRGIAYEVEIPDY
ncbi:hypothetical protein H1P_840009 [Hyella patelloides LEGE 07179]|uniref:Uncharacterized protein n=2 Tax=Hyella TaxID=945733 RepID=A0A563W4L6_9CYAN|nr:hypothetical protein H1P_840009 [Hyella patelloides LEGE 07179]